jgi:hypothetical protein
VWYQEQPRVYEPDCRNWPWDHMGDHEVLVDVNVEYVKGTFEGQQRESASVIALTSWRSSD